MVSDRIISFSLKHPKWVTFLMIVATVLISVWAIVPSLYPEVFPHLAKIKIDTDPENMLSKQEPTRVFHNKMRRILNLHDIVVLGVVNEKDPNGVFNVRSLNTLYQLTQYAVTLRGDVLGVKEPSAGVIEADVIAPSRVDNIEQGGPGVVKFEWLMPKPPATEEEALAIRKKAERIPFLDGTLISEDGKALAIYLPITSKDMSSKVYNKLLSKISELKKQDPDDQFFITGLPVAEDVFGVEMFKQMAISAPMAALVVFLLMLYFFRKLVLIVSPMIVGMVSVICTMGLLVITGNTIHIMSSMIPIFVMPIAVLDSIHILSEFFDRYQQIKNKAETVKQVMHSLFMPMLYTSLTTIAGFASLALTPIPPVQVFGVFVAFGVMLAWILTVTFIPAYIMLLNEKRLENFGAVFTEDEEELKSNSLTAYLLKKLGWLTYSHAKMVLAGAVIVTVVAVYGISLIRVNDNPTKWFKERHPIRIADRILNKHFGGTYMAYLSLSPEGEEFSEPSQSKPINTEEIPGSTDLPSLPSGLGSDDSDNNEPVLPSGLGGDEGNVKGDTPALPAGLGGTPAQDDGLTIAENVPVVKDEIFKDPEVLRYIEGLQHCINGVESVGKSNSLADIVKTVHRDLMDGTDTYFTIPDTSSAVAQCLSQFQSSHRRNDLWHFVTPDYRLTSIWVQLKSGDNTDMQRVVDAVNEYVAKHPMKFTINGKPVVLQQKWFGQTYINVIWQNKMVKGMRSAFLGSFLVVLLMMIVLFRSGLWGLLCMIPLTVTIGLIYGVIGFAGRDYDMPVAVLSSLSLGLAVDFAIHFLARSRMLYAKYKNWENTNVHVFGEPARAIMRNIIIISVGFLPLLLAPLVPYNTVGIFLASILVVSGGGALIILPAIVRLFEKRLFPKTKLCCITCSLGTMSLIAVTLVLLVWVNVHQMMPQDVPWLTKGSVIVLVVLLAVSVALSLRGKCKERITVESYVPEKEE